MNNWNPPVPPAPAPDGIYFSFLFEYKIYSVDLREVKKVNLLSNKLALAGDILRRPVTLISPLERVS